MADPRQLLLISYFWPPFGGAGVQRALKLVRAAPDFGWQVSVVASPPRGKDSRDETLMADVPDDIVVRRADHWRLARLGGKVVRLTPPDPYIPWYWPAVAAAKELVASRPFDAIMSTSMPYTSHLVAKTIRQQTGLPWLADLRDPWTDNRFLTCYQGDGPFQRWRRWTDARLERQVYDDADLVTVTVDPLRRLLVKKWGLDEDKTLLVRNGYDEDDFAGILPPPAARPQRAPPGDDEQLQLLFAGSMYKGYTIEPFCAAWQMLLERRPDARMRLTLHTQSLALFNRLAKRYPLIGERAEPGPRLSHSEIVRRYADADMLVLSCLDDLSIPGKLFEYIRSGTPVMAWSVADSEAHALIGDTGAGVVVAHDDVAAGADALERWYEAWCKGEPLTHPDAQAVAQLERRVAFKRLFTALDEAVAARPGPARAD